MYKKTQIFLFQMSETNAFNTIKTFPKARMATPNKGKDTTTVPGAPKRLKLSAPPTGKPSYLLTQKLKTAAVQPQSAVPVVELSSDDEELVKQVDALVSMKSKKPVLSRSRAVVVPSAELVAEEEDEEGDLNAGYRNNALEASHSGPVKNWVGTWQVPDVETPLNSLEYFKLKFAAITSYCCIGHLESAPTTGKLHYHLAFSLLKKSRLASLNKNLGIEARYKNSIHFLPMRGTMQEATAYATKEGSAEWVHGEMTQTPAQQVQQSWEEARDHASRGDFEKIDAEKWIRFDKAFIRQFERANAHRVPKQVPLDNVFIYGPTGSGKSYFCHHGEGRNEDNTYMKMVSSQKWFDLYKFQETIVIEDMDRSFTEIQALKVWTDHYKFIAEVKSSSMNIRPKKTMITSNSHFDDIFGGLPPMDYAALKRRFKFILFYKDWNPESGEPLEFLEWPVGVIPSLEECHVKMGLVNDSTNLFNHATSGTLRTFIMPESGELSESVPDHHNNPAVSDPCDSTLPLEVEDEEEEEVPEESKTPPPSPKPGRGYSSHAPAPKMVREDE